MKSPTPPTPQPETADLTTALRRVLDEVQNHGFMRLIDLDPYFGTIEIPLQEEIEKLAAAYGEDFAFFTDLLKELQEEMELYFEETELYEDEEYEQFAQECDLIKKRFSESFASEHAERLKALAKRIEKEATS